MNSVVATPDERAAKIAEVFGSFRAEWLSEKIFTYYTQPSYFPVLETPTPCVLSGGRGTGKTTVLLCLSYEGRFALSNYDVSKIREWSYYGLYYRVDTNRVPAFSGPELSDAQWKKLFGHYVNLILIGKLVDFLSWYCDALKCQDPLTKRECERLSKSLHLPECGSLDELKEGLVDGLLDFESFLNNIDASALPNVSMQGAPVSYLTGVLTKKDEFSGKTFFFLIDEYESFLEYQQVVVNTMIKHAGGGHTFKIGIKELGWKNRSTLSPDQILMSPADYAVVDIGASLSEADFSNLAKRVLNARLRHVFPEIGDIAELLPELSIDHEAQLLGVDEHVSDFEKHLNGDKKLIEFSKSLKPLQRYFAILWANEKSISVEKIINSWRASGTEWNARYENYKYAFLFAIKRNRTGIRKYYSGWSTYVKLSAGNLRYLLELSVEALILNARKGGDGQPVSHQNQTEAAEEVAKKNFRELDGASLSSGHLTKLLLGLGRVFYAMARQPEGHAPEVNQFHFGDGARITDQVKILLNEGVTHLALTRWAGNKLSINDVQSFDYAIHPIYAPFFVFSFRKKRKMKLDPDMILALIHRPGDAISALVKRTGRAESEDIPEQLSLFEGYYGKSAA